MKTKVIRRSTHTEVHIKGKNLLIFLKKCEKAGEEDTLTDRWRIVMKP